MTGVYVFFVIMAVLLLSLKSEHQGRNVQGHRNRRPSGGYAAPGRDDGEDYGNTYTRIGHPHYMDDTDYECPRCSARFKDDGMRCPECGARFDGTENDMEEYYDEEDEEDMWDEEDGL